MRLFDKIFGSENKKDKDDEIVSLSMQSFNLWNDGKLEESIEKEKEALKMAEEINNEVAISCSLSNLGNRYAQLQQWDDAISCFRELIEICKSTGRKDEELDALFGLGNCYRYTKQFDLAIDTFKNASELSREVQNEGVLFGCLVQIEKCYRHSGQHDKALPYLNEALTLSRNLKSKENEATIINDFGNLMIAKKQWSDAINYFKKAADLFEETGNYEMAQTTIQNQILALTDKCIDEISKKDTYNEHIRIQGTRPLMTKEMAKETFPESKYLDDALTIMKESIAKGYVFNPAFVQEIAVRSDGIGFIDITLEFWKVELEICSKNDRFSHMSPQVNIAENLRLLGDFAYHDGNFDSAIKYYEESLEYSDLEIVKNNLEKAKKAKEGGKVEELYPKSDEEKAEKYYTIGVALSNEGRIDEAITQYIRSIELNPNYSPAHNNLGLSYSDNGRINEAIKELKEAIRLDPDNFGAHANLGSIYVNVGRYDDAIKEFETAESILPPDNDDIKVVKLNIGWAYYRKGSYDDSIEQYRKALEIDPDYAGARDNLGLALLEKGQIDEAIKEIELSLELGRNTHDAYYDLGMCYERQKDYKTALKYYKKALELKEDYDEAINALKRLENI